MNDTAITRRAVLTRLGVGALAVGATPSALAAATARTKAHEGAEDFERLLKLASVPSMSLATIKGDTIETMSLGIRKTGEAERVSADSVYSAASLTKLVFAYVFLGLVNEGVVALDTPVREYLPLPNPDDARSATITARHLLSHSGGWRNWRNSPTPALTADFVPGARWSYSGEGYFFLQRVLEARTGKSVSQLARERVFDPLGMKRSSMVALAELEAFQVSGHTGRGDLTQPFGRPALVELRRLLAARSQSLEAATVADSEAALKTADAALPALPNFLTPNAASSMLTTANDFGMFLRHVVTAARKGGAAKAIVDLLMAPQVRCNDAVQWGLGAGLEDIGERRYAWQWGDNPGFKNFYFADPRREEAFVIFTNGDRGARVYERVIRSMTGVDHPAFLWS